MKEHWLNAPALIVFLALVLHGAPALPVAAGVAGALLLGRARARRRKTL